MIRIVASLLFALAPWPASAAPAVAVAAAANLVHAAEALQAAFRQAEPGTIVTTSTGASGSLYAQIRNGAPFDVFLSADTEYPQQLVAAGAGDAASLRIFATGRLVLWTTRPDLDLAVSAALIRHAAVKKIALAQPRTAPYGRAAQAVIERLGVWREAQPKIVLGESISQTAQFVETGSADVGFVALAIVRSPRLAGTGRWVEIPPEAHPGVSLDHAGVLTARGARNPAARRYLDFLATAPARKILEAFGYSVRAPL